MRRGVELPTDFEKIVLRCLAKRPEDRFQSVGALRAALKALNKATRSSTID
jgi:hypothetical protein